MKKTKIKIEGCKYLSEYLTELPSHCLINKGVTGCGGTTLELLSKRNSIILVPTIALVKSKMADPKYNILGVYGKTKIEDIEKYIDSNIPYKKIMGTYDSLPKLMNIISNYESYFLLIDEYHLLFNDYSFRREAIRGVLNNYIQFDNWCFLTATPIKDEFILDELKDVDQIEYEWDNASLIDVNIHSTAYVLKELINVIEKHKDKNIHVFLNSIKTINQLEGKITDDYRVVCSSQSKGKVKNYAEITSPVKKLNFYTSCSFEGCLLPEQKVLTDKGLLNCEDVTLQNKLVNKDGKLVDIYNLQKYEKVNDDVYTIKLGNTFRTTTFTKIHPILVSEHPAKYPFKFKECKNVKKGDWVVYPNYYSKIRLINLNWWDQFKNLTNKEHINPLKLSDFWWFIGLFLGDGWTQNDGYRVFISVNKEETLTLNRLHNFCKVLNRNYRLKDKQGCFEVIINDKQLVDFLNYYIHKGAGFKRIPEIFKFINPEYKISLLNGYLDSDGCIINSNNNYRASFVSINLELLEDIQDILTSLGIKSSLKKLRNIKQMKIEDRIINCHTTYDLNISHNDLYVFKTLNNDTHYQKLQKIKDLESKSRIPKYVSMEFSNNKELVYFKIKDITKLQYTGTVYNFECNTHTYCCRHMTTHNCDIYDENGLSIILSDTKISTTILDISTKVRQICGRIRNSKYGNKVIFIVNVHTHRYMNTTLEQFKSHVKESERLGLAKMITINSCTGDRLLAELVSFNADSCASIYINKDDFKGIFFDINLKNIDIYNYTLITEIYSNAIHVFGEFNNSEVYRVVGDNDITDKKINTIINWIILTKIEYTYEELYDAFGWRFEETVLGWNQYTIKKYFPPHTKTRKTINGKKQTIYTFDSKYITIK